MTPQGDVVWFLSMCRLRDGVWAHDPVHGDVVLPRPSTDASCTTRSDLRGSVQFLLSINKYMIISPTNPPNQTTDRPDSQPTPTPQPVPHHTPVDPLLPVPISHLDAIFGTAPARYRLPPSPKPCRPNPTSAAHARVGPCSAVSIH
jgi:hypothetical protein